MDADISMGGMDSEPGSSSTLRTKSPMGQDSPRIIDVVSRQAAQTHSNNIDTEIGAKQPVNGKSTQMNSGLPQGNVIRVGDIDTSLSANENSSRTNCITAQTFKDLKPRYFLPSRNPKEFIVDFRKVPIIHHVNNSESQQIMWLLEELNIPFVQFCHKRGEDFGKPSTFPNEYEWGKGPFLLAQNPNNSVSIICSSPSITSHLIRAWDYGEKFQTYDLDRENYIQSMYRSLHRAASDRLMIDLKCRAEGDTSTKLGTIRRTLVRLSCELRRSPGRPFFMGAHPSRVDVLLEWPMTLVHQRRWINLEKEYPILYCWLQEVYSRAAWKRAYERGSDYDFRVLPNECR